MDWKICKKNSSAKEAYPDQPAYRAHPLSKPLVWGSVLLVTSAFILVRSHSLVALLLGVIGIVLLIAGATKQQIIPPPLSTTLPDDQICSKCGAACQPNWNYCAQCTTPLTNRPMQTCPHCGLKLETGWRFCARCTKKLT